MNECEVSILVLITLGSAESDKVFKKAGPGLVLGFLEVLKLLQWMAWGVLGRGWSSEGSLGLVYKAFGSMFCFCCPVQFNIHRFPRTSVWLFGPE
jgi:hypothetical protein